MIPEQKCIEIPLLEVLVELGGQGKPKQIYPLVTKKFNEIRDEDLAEILPSGGNKWTNRIQWVRQKLVSNQEIDGSNYGSWRITEKGRQRLLDAKLEPKKATMILPIPQTFQEQYDDYQTSFRNTLLYRINSLEPFEFEQFARRLLEVYGFVNMEVTRQSKDGGIDGHGKLKVGLAMMKVAFQCKKWQEKNNVGRRNVDEFQGAIQGEFEQGIFFTTSDFTPEARDASLKKGAVPIILFNGEGIVDLMIEKGFGVEKVPLYAYYERPGDFKETIDEDEVRMPNTKGLKLDDYRNR